MSRNRILGAVHPGIVMIAANHPLIRRRAPRDARDHVAQRLLAPVGFDPQVHARRPGTDVIGDAEAAPPFLRSDGTFKSGEKGLRVTVRNRQDRDFGERACLRQRQSPRVLRRSDARRQWIAGIHFHLHDAAALHAIAGAPRTLRVRVALHKSIVFWIGVNDAPDSPVLSRDLGLDAAPGPEVAGDHDRPLDRDAQPIELLVVRRHAVVHVHERRGDIAVDRIGVVGRELLALLCGGRIAGNGRFLELGHESRWRDQLDDPIDRSREQHIKCLDVRIEPEALELRENPLGVVLIVRGADVMRSRGEPTHVCPQRIGGGNRAKLSLPIPLGLGGFRSEATQVITRG